MSTIEDQLSAGYHRCITDGDPELFIDAILYLLGSRRRTMLARRLESEGDPLLANRPHMPSWYKMLRMPDGQVITLDDAIAGFYEKKIQDPTRFAASVQASPGRIVNAFRNYVIDQWRAATRYAKQHEPLGTTSDDAEASREDFRATTVFSTFDASREMVLDVDRLLANDRLIEACRLALKENHELMLYLHLDASGQTVREIADRLDCSRDTVENRRKSPWGLRPVPANPETVVGRLNTQFLPPYDDNSDHLYQTLLFILKNLADSLGDDREGVQP